MADDIYGAFDLFERKMDDAIGGFDILDESPAAAAAVLVDVKSGRLEIIVVLIRTFLSLFSRLS